MKIGKTFLIVFSLLGGGTFALYYFALQNPKGKELLKGFNQGNTLLVFIILAAISLGFAFLNNAMDAEKARREALEQPSGKKKAKK